MLSRYPPAATTPNRPQQIVTNSNLRGHIARAAVAAGLPENVGIMLDAISHRQIAVLHALLENPNNADALDTVIPTTQNKTPMHFAVLSKDLNVVAEVVLAGGSVNEVEDGDGETPLTLAMAHFPQCVTVMMDGRNVNPRRVNSRGQSLLYSALSGKSLSRTWDRMSLVKKLVETYHLPTKTKCNAGFTPAEWARENYLGLGTHADEIIEYLEHPPVLSNHLAGLRQIQHRSAGAILQMPSLRILVVLLLALLHCLEYCADVVDRSSVDTEAEFNFVFDIFNHMAVNWPTNDTFLLATKLVTLFMGGLIGIFITFLFYYYVLQRLFALQVVGAGELSGGGRFRGALVIVLFYGVACGIYCGGLVYNAILSQRYTAEDSRDYVMGARIGITNLEAMKSYWVASLAIDWYVLLLVIDTMFQQATQRVNLPEQFLSDFLESLHPVMGKVRLIAFWALLILGYFNLIFLMAYLDNSSLSLFHDVQIATSTPAQRIAMCSISMFLALVAMAQDWTLPRLASAPQVFLPGTRWEGNNSWMLWFLLSLVLAMDGRLLVAELTLWNQKQSFSEDATRFSLAAALFPLFVGSMLMFVRVLRSSRYHCCGMGGGTEVVEFSDIAVETEQPVSPKPHIEMSPRVHPFAPRSNRIVPADDREMSPHPLSPINTTSTAVAAGKRRTANDVWFCAYNDDIIKMCTILDADPTLVNARGGIGLICDPENATAEPCSARDPGYAATPLHYAIAGQSKSCISALLTRGANPRMRTAHGMFSCRELAAFLRYNQFLDMMGNTQ